MSKDKGKSQPLSRPDFKTIATVLEWLSQRDLAGLVRADGSEIAVSDLESLIKKLHASAASKPGRRTPLGVAAGSAADQSLWTVKKVFDSFVSTETMRAEAAKTYRGLIRSVVLAGPSDRVLDVLRPAELVTAVDDAVRNSKTLARNQTRRRQKIVAALKKYFEARVNSRKVDANVAVQAFTRTGEARPPEHYNGVGLSLGCIIATLRRYQVETGCPTEKKMTNVQTVCRRLARAYPEKCITDFSAKDLVDALATFDLSVGNRRNTIFGWSILFEALEHYGDVDADPVDEAFPDRQKSVRIKAAPIVPLSLLK
ncbi:MAG: hypothetical protein HKM24_01315 [Gammaproteobacteria bacterium]|nr:hypothetical protein [Gammaproteobacteria bacterium]